jgi:hypothetical protein
MDLLRTYFPIFTPDILPVSPGILRLLSKAPSSAWCTVLCLLFFSYILGHFKDHQNQVSSTHVDGFFWGCEAGSCEQGGHRCQAETTSESLMSSQFPASPEEDWLSVFSLIKIDIVCDGWVVSAAPENQRREVGCLKPE